MKSGYFLFLLLLLCPQPALAQADTTPGNVLPVEKGGTPRSAILRLSGSSFSEGAPKLVIGNLVDGRGGVQLYFQPGAGPDQNLTDALAAESVQKMIELSPEQQKEFREIRRRLAKRQQELSQKYEHRNDTSIIQPLREQINRKYEQERVALSTEIDQQLQEKLVPRQLRLIGQYRFNQSVRIFGFSKTLSRQHLVDSIGTTEKQVRELEKIRKEAEEEIRKKVAEIRQ
ncbi:MAG: hypothetical protein VX768_00055, partial [Planctomycetota bacterium]|nr:hypothetical protein [Planctomycetota bacterium]